MSTALLETIALQDAEAQIALRKEEAKLKGQAAHALELLKDIGPLLPAYITSASSSNIVDNLAQTFITFTIPAHLRVPIERRGRSCTKNSEGEHEIKIRIFTDELKAFHRDMLKDLAFVIRGIRDVTK